MTHDKTILQTKTIIPPVPDDAIARRRLIQKINQGIQKKLVLVCSPPGYGKSTLLAQWAAQTRLPVLWLNLDPSENVQSRFFEFFFTALARLFPALELDRYLEAVYSHTLSSEEIIDIYHEIMSSIQEECVIVLDDFQVIEAPSIYRTLQFSLERQPQNVHIILSSRTLPPIALNNLRLKRQVMEINADDLRFTHDEIKDFFNRSCNRCLSEAEIAEIEKRTEGWVACLQLAALSLEGLSLEETHQYVQAFTSSNRYVWDYLIEEVFSRFSKETQEFMKKTSILRRLNALLCDEVTQSRSSREALNQLDRWNLLVPLDDKGRWYRYPSMMADFLFGLLEDEVGLPGLRELHMRASAWYERMGNLPDAVNHAMAAQDLERAGALLNKINADLNLDKYFNWPKKFLDLPDEVLQTQPDVCIDCAWSLVVSYNLNMVERPLRIAEQAWQMAGNRVGLGRVFGLRAFINRLAGETSEAIRLGELSLQHLEKDNNSFRNTSLFVLGSSYLDAGRAAEAEQLLAQAARDIEILGDFYSAGMATAALARSLIQRGQLKRAERIYQQVIHFTDKKLHDQVEAGHIFLGTIYYEWNQLDLAEEHLRKELRSAQGRARRYTPLGYITLASLHFEVGERAKAADDLGQALSSALQLGNQGWARMAKAQQARLALRDGDLKTAEQWAQALGPAAQWDLQNFKRYFDWMTLARLRIAQFRARREPALLQEAIHLCDRLLEIAALHGRGRDQIEILSQKALALWELGERAAALEALQGALALAEPENFIRTFIDERQPLSELLTWAIANRLSLNYISRLQSEYHFPVADVQRTPKASGAPSPLSERELEILQAMAAGLSTQAMAEKFYISPMTVRTHIKNIFRKLEANNRMQAIDLARIRKII